MKAKDLADKALANPDSAGLFGSKDGMTARQVLEGTAQGVKWNIDFIYSTSQDAAVASTRPTISVGNLFGPSFVTKIDAAFNLQGYWNYGDSVENADTILHELGHVLRYLGFTGGDFAQDDGENSVNWKNSQLIMDDRLKGLKP